MGGALIEMDDGRAAMKARFVSKNQTIGGKPFKVIQLDPTKFKGASIGKDDTKSMDVTKAKENWRYAKDSKFRKIWLRSTSLRPGIPSKICKEAIRQMLQKLGLQCKLLSWRLLKNQ